MDILDDRTIYMTETTKMLGYETDWAKQKRLQRNKKGVDMIETKKDIVHQEIDIDIELDKEIDKERKI